MRSALAISVVIPALNEERGIGQAVRSASAADEIIVVDGGSQDATCDLAAKLPCRLVRTSPGRGKQLRAGARQAAGDVLLFLHADCRLAGDAIGQLRRLADDRGKRPLFGAFRQRIDDPRRRFRWLERGNALRAAWCRLPYGDQAMFIDQDTYRACGEFADAPLMEDVMLSRAAARRTPPVLLPGPVHVNPRRWQDSGVLRRTAHNWCLLTAFFCGVSPERLAKWYGPRKTK